MIMFLTIEDYKAVADAQTLDVIHQSDEANLQRAERYAIGEISSYLRDRYDVSKAFAATGEERNQHLIMITCDVALYHLSAWLPKRIGFEIRDIRHKQAIDWLKSIQAGEASSDIPVLADDSGQDIGNPIRYGSEKKNKYDY
jgi:phage gp36-like protein